MAKTPPPTRRLVPFRCAGDNPTRDEFVRAQQEAQKVIDALWAYVESLQVRLVAGNL